MTNDKTTKFDALMDDLRGKLRAKYEASEALKAEFACGEDYAAYTLNTAIAKPLVRKWKADHDDAENLAAFNAAEAKGRVRILGPRARVG